MTNKIYANFITELVVPMLKKELVADFASKLVWQDDCDKKHRTKYVLETIDNFFDERIAVEEQSPKMADI